MFVGATTSSTVDIYDPLRFYSRINVMSWWIEIVEPVISCPAITLIYRLALTGGGLIKTCDDRRAY
jgi:hypothetical protein